ncbi:MAG: PD40 domain-containing protein, partial [Bacteroidetes bacterium]|nr:PD40 domain-containing protein [Bacteroidota bacterium]
MKKYLAFATGGILSLALPAAAQTDAGLFRFPDVSATQIVFTYANDVWIVPKQGGTAIRLSSPPGVESFPKFSPDGQQIAFSGNYDGNRDAYVMPVSGGVPQRLTTHGYGDRVIDWQPDGKRILFASGRESGKERFNQFYAVAPTGGPVEKLPLAYAEFGSYSPDGKRMALTFRTQIGRNWKRYKGGWHADIHIYDFAAQTDENISGGSDASDELPMWHDNSIYFLSDRGPELRMNLWRYDLSAKSFTQLTHFKDYDAHFPSIGPDDIVFEQGGKLYLYPLSGGEAKEVKVNIVADEASIKPYSLAADKYVQHMYISPDGNRVVAEARGDLFSIPAQYGYVKNLTNTSGAAERYPAWSPDGKWIAYWSDQSGEYELYIGEAAKPGGAKKITSYGPGFRYSLFWSPDNKKLAFIDKTQRIKIADVASGQTTDVDRGLRMTPDGLENFAFAWSPDSRWLVYSRDLDNSHNAVFLYNLADKKLTQATSGFYDCSKPVFSPDGKYLYLLTSRHFDALYSDIDNNFIYANSTQPAFIVLKKSTPSLLYPRNDAVSEKKEDAEEKKDEKKDDKKTGKKDDKKDDKKDKPEAAAKKSPPPVEIDLDGLETRLIVLPVSAGNYSNISGVKGKILYLKAPNTGSGIHGATLKYFDIEKREEKTVLDADDYQLAADGEKILVKKGGDYAVLRPEEGQRFEKPLRLNEMQMTIDPRQEWKQIFTDSWRLERDYFYDPNMHGVDWNLVQQRYGSMLKSAMTREDVNFIIGEMIGELNASHTYNGGGDEEDSKSKSVGYLGVNYEAEGNYYKIKQVLHGAPWDAEARSPLALPGVAIKEGDYLLAVNGIALTTAQDPFAAFQGLAGKVVELTYNSSPSWTGAKTTVVQTMNDEYRLRNLAWIEGNRKRAEEATNGEAGYIFVPSTGTDGQDELIRQFAGQWDKKALVIDERFNNGGQIPDRFIEMLNRSPLAFWATRDGQAWPWPPFAHFGPKVMLINGWSGSGGDAFPDYFRKKGLGPLIGTRTWGGLIGITGIPQLVDGGYITAPDFRMYNPDGSWFKEGHGVDPDIEVPENLGSMAKGVDPQLERAITEIKDLIKKKGFTRPGTP